MCRHAGAAALAVALLYAQSAPGAVTINLNYAGNFPIDGDVLHPDFFPRRAVEQARDNWITAIGNGTNDVITVAVKWAAPQNVGTVCGVGRIVTQNAAGDRPVTSEITLNSDIPIAAWFAPSDPNDMDFYRQPNDIPAGREPWRGIAADTGSNPAFGKEDMVSCAKHEFGHALAFYHGGAGNPLTAYRNEVDGDNLIDLRMADFGNNAIKIKVDAANASADIRSHYKGGEMYPYPSDPAGAAVMPVHHILMDKHLGGQPSERIVMSPYDVAALAVIWNLPPGTYDLEPKGIVPEPSTLALLFFAVSCTLRRSRRRR